MGKIFYSWLLGPAIVIAGTSTSVRADSSLLGDPAQNAAVPCRSLMNDLQQRQSWEVPHLQPNPRALENCQNHLEREIIMDEIQLDKIRQQNELQIRLDREEALRIEQEQQQEKARRSAEEIDQRKTFLRQLRRQDLNPRSSTTVQQEKEIKDQVIERIFRQHNENVRQHFESIRKLMEAIGDPSK